MATKEELLTRLAECVLEMEEDEVIEVAQEYADAGYDVQEGISEGLIAGMNQAAELFDQEEYFIPEILICSAAMYNGLEVFRPLLPQKEQSEERKIVIGVVEGDTHDIGKNIVKIMLEAAGYTMIDLGRDVEINRFAQAAKDEGACVVAMSTLMTVSMPNMKKIIDRLSEIGYRDQVKVIVGGAPISPAFAEQIGADGYSATATEAVELVNRLLAS